jgi:pilus assembly protein Flp/PilA
MQFVKQFIREEEGQDVVEYGLLVATIALVVLAATTSFGNDINVWFKGLSTDIKIAGQAPAGP